MSVNLPDTVISKRDMQQARKYIYDLAKNTSEYKKLYKPFRRINGYANYKQVALDLASASYTANYLGLSKLDQTLKEVAFSAVFAAQHSSPIYWLDTNLFQAFLQTDIPKDLSLLADPAIPHCLLMLPQLISSPDAEKLSFVFVHFLAKNTVFEPVKFGNQYLHHVNPTHNRLRWITTFPSGSAYSSCSEIPEAMSGELVHGNFEISDRVSYVLGNQNILTERDFTNVVDKIVVHTLLFLRCFNDSAISQDENVFLNSGTGFGKKSKANTEQLINPIWIGRGYKPRQRQANRADEEEIRKYQIHTKNFWRRGHYRHVSVGKKEEGQRKLIWVEPILLAGKHEIHNYYLCSYQECRQLSI